MLIQVTKLTTGDRGAGSGSFILFLMEQVKFISAMMQVLGEWYGIGFSK